MKHWTIWLLVAALLTSLTGCMYHDGYRHGGGYEGRRDGGDHDRRGGGEGRRGGGERGDHDRRH